MFLAAVPVLWTASEAEDIILTNLKVTQSMMPGRTKGFKFYLLVTLIHNDQQIDFVLSHPFLLWSNVNQEGFPRDDRARFLKARIETNKRRRGKDSESDHEDDQNEAEQEPRRPARFANQARTAEKRELLDHDYDPDMEEPKPKKRK